MSSVVPAAPGTLETIRAFVNTQDIDLGTDAIAEPRQLETWLSDAGLLGRATRATPGDLRRAAGLREALREAMAANHDGEPVPAPVLRVINQAAARAKLSVELTADSAWAMRTTAKGVDASLGRLVALVADAMNDGTWSRLKVCINDSCRWAFYDRSRARSGKWCSMQICGNRAKQQAWRSRLD